MAVPPPPLDAKYFDLQFTGIQAQFKDVQGVSISVPLHTSSTTDAMGQPIRQRTASAVEYGSITCSAGATSDLGLDKWIAAVADKGVENNFKDGTLTLFSAANTAVAVWTLTKAVITGLTVNTIGVEHGSHLDVQATFDCEKLERTK
ncbi:MAG: T4-like virus tail tube protein gp19 [Solirubrobacteraceae bacterium]|jgi:phage tail-like protein|nr:T4-like virus tail tube protein gp19 [Solirubrobacteraceae bacterium]